MKSGPIRRALRGIRGAAIALLALYGGLHLADLAYSLHKSNKSLFEETEPAGSEGQTDSPLPPLETDRQLLASSLTRVLSEDGVSEPDRWAEAILRASPTSHPGYVALLTAQIRRESHFLAADLEWLFDRLIPDLLHEIGLPDPITTIGPMQVKRWSLRGPLEAVTGTSLTLQQVKELSYRLELGVAACVAFTDRIATDYDPDRRIPGWRDSLGLPGLEPVGARNLASDWAGKITPERREIAAFQKWLSDLNHSPIPLDGSLGPRTRDAAFQFVAHLPLNRRASFLERLESDLEPGTGIPLAQSSSFEAVRLAWQTEFGQSPPLRISPRITHAPHVAFVFADFHSGRGSCRIAALQHLLNETLGTELELDGKEGPLTRAALRSLFEHHEPNPDRREDFLRLVDRGGKRLWVREQGLKLAATLFSAERGEPAPRSLVPDFRHGSTSSHWLKGLGEISIESYVSGSTAFFEDYHHRLLVYSGSPPPRSGDFTAKRFE